jgi:hypothetical protein
MLGLGCWPVVGGRLWCGGHGWWERGENEEKMAGGGFYFGFIFLSFGLIFVWLSYNRMGVCSAI